MAEKTVPNMNGLIPLFPPHRRKSKLARIQMKSLGNHGFGRDTGASSAGATFLHLAPAPLHPRFFFLISVRLLVILCEFLPDQFHQHFRLDSQFLCRFLYFFIELVQNGFPGGLLRVRRKVRQKASSRTAKGFLPRTRPLHSRRMPRSQFPWRKPELPSDLSQRLFLG